jgi:predicted nucleic acid-binding protein
VRRDLAGVRGWSISLTRFHMVCIACAVAADTQYLVTRDDDLLSLNTYKRVRIIAPEKFIHILRHQE